MGDGTRDGTCRAASIFEAQAPAATFTSQLSSNSLHHGKPSSLAGGAGTFSTGKSQPTNHDRYMMPGLRRRAATARWRGRRKLGRNGLSLTDPEGVSPPEYLRNLRDRLLPVS